MGKLLQFVKLYKSGGVVQRTPAARQAARSNRIKEYFYGNDNSLTPVSININAANMMVFRTGRGPYWGRSSICVLLFLAAVQGGVGRITCTLSITSGSAYCMG